MVRILVTGGAGFQGSHLCEALLAMGHRVTVLNTLSDAANRNMRNFAANELADIVFGSVFDGELVSKTARDHDVVFHLAANINVDTGALTSGVLRGTTRTGAGAPGCAGPGRACRRLLRNSSRAAEPRTLHPPVDRILHQSAVRCR